MTTTEQEQSQEQAQEEEQSVAVESTTPSTTSSVLLDRSQSQAHSVATEALVAGEDDDTVDDKQEEQYERTAAAVAARADDDEKQSVNTNTTTTTTTTASNNNIYSNVENDYEEIVQERQEEQEQQQEQRATYSANPSSSLVTATSRKTTATTSETATGPDRARRRRHASNTPSSDSLLLDDLGELSKLTATLALADDVVSMRVSDPASASSSATTALTPAHIAMKNRKRFLQKYSNPVRSDAKLKITDFSLLCTLGSGAFGRVLLSNYKATDEFYAIKVLAKAKLYQQRQINSVIRERNILAACDHPNIIKLHFCFKDSTYVYLGLDLMCYGDLYLLLKKRRCFDEDQARFYAANIFLALEYLHINDIIYRDLKPENVLIKNNGYLKLTDFGFAKRSEHLSYSSCGTPDYMSPEILRSEPYGKSVDWWAFGIFVYELNCGKPPFVHENNLILYEMIKEGAYSIPKKFSLKLIDLCKRLLESDVRKRLGCLPARQSADVREHKWFTSARINWMDIYNQSVVAPYVPDTSINPINFALANAKTESSLTIFKNNEYKREFHYF